MYLQLRNSLRHLINTTDEAQRGLGILHFLPGSPGSPGHYRMDPTATIHPGQTNYLSRTAVLSQPVLPHPLSPPTPHNPHNPLHFFDASNTAAVLAPESASHLPQQQIPTTALSHGNHSPTLATLQLDIEAPCTVHCGQPLYISNQEMPPPAPPRHTPESRS